MHFVGTSDDVNDNYHDLDYDNVDHGHDDNNDGNGGGDDSVSWMGDGHASDTGGWTNF